MPTQALDSLEFHPSDEVATPVVFLEALWESEALYDTAGEALKTS